MPVTAGTYVDELTAKALELKLKEENDRLRTARANMNKHAEVSRRLKEQLEATKQDPQWKKLFAKRSTLPICALAGELLDRLRSHDAVVVCGETGCGKTTQVPQFLLDDAIEREQGGACNIVCTQPRRVAATSIAERVSAERCEKNGVGGNGSLVGHHVRLDAKITGATRLTFCTTGILLRRLQGDRMLTDVTHVVVDEVHERSLDGDFLLTLLRDLPRRRREAGLPPVKLVLMSATLNAALFSEYLGGSPVISAPGRSFPVDTIYLENIYDTLDYVIDPDNRSCRRPKGKAEDAMKAIKAGGGGDRRRQNELLGSWGEDAASEFGGEENPENPDYDSSKYEYCKRNTRLSLSRLDESVIDYDLIEELLAYVDDVTDDGAILVFLPGIGEVTGLLDRLASSPRFKDAVLTPLHSALTNAEQREAFRVPKPGVRKIVVATNVAETSVTIEDIVVVIDSGRVKERQWDPRRGMASLEEGWVSRAAAETARRSRRSSSSGNVLCALHLASRKRRDAAIPSSRNAPRAAHGSRTADRKPRFAQRRRSGSRERTRASKRGSRCRGEEDAHRDWRFRRARSTYCLRSPPRCTASRCEGCENAIIRSDSTVSLSDSNHSRNVELQVALSIVQGVEQSSRGGDACVRATSRGVLGRRAAKRSPSGRRRLRRLYRSIERKSQRRTKICAEKCARRGHDETDFRNAHAVRRASRGHGRHSSPRRLLTSR